MAEKYPKIIVFHIFVRVSACVRVRDFRVLFARLLSALITLFC